MTVGLFLRKKLLFMTGLRGKGQSFYSFMRLTRSGETQLSVSVKAVILVLVCFFGVRFYSKGVSCSYMVSALIILLAFTEPKLVKVSMNGNMTKADFYNLRTTCCLALVSFGVLRIIVCDTVMTIVQEWYIFDPRAQVAHQAGPF